MKKEKTFVILFFLCMIAFLTLNNRKMKKNFYKLLVIIFSLSFSNSNAQFFNYLSSKARVEQLIYNDLGTNGTKITTNFKGQPLSNSDDNSSVQIGRAHV